MIVMKLNVWEFDGKLINKIFKYMYFLNIGEKNNLLFVWIGGIILFGLVVILIYRKKLNKV